MSDNKSQEDLIKEQELIAQDQERYQKEIMKEVQKITKKYDIIVEDQYNKLEAACEEIVVTKDPKMYDLCQQRVALIGQAAGQQVKNRMSLSHQLFKACYTKLGHENIPICKDYFLKDIKNNFDIFLDGMSI